jgi:hypothetical protein
MIAITVSEHLIPPLETDLKISKIRLEIKMRMTGQVVASDR